MIVATASRLVTDRNVVRVWLAIAILRFGTCSRSSAGSRDCMRSLLSLTGNPNEADDVLQNTNLVLLKKREAFRPDADFGAWALQIARLEVQRLPPVQRPGAGAIRRRVGRAVGGPCGALAGDPAAELKVLAMVHVAAVVVGARNADPSLRRQFGRRHRRAMGTLGRLDLANPLPSSRQTGRMRQTRA